jgi:aldose 1-epimerase
MCYTTQKGAEHMIEIHEETVTESISLISFTIPFKLAVTFSNIGASIFRIKFSDRDNNYENVTLTPESVNTWIENRTFSGAVIAPLAGRYEVHESTLEQNRPPVHFHGGTNGYDKKIWTYELTSTETEAQVLFSLHDEEHDLSVQVIYRLTLQNQLTMEIKGTTTQETFFNPTNHLYFNLNGNPLESIENHRLFLDSDTYYKENADKLIVSSTKITPNSCLDFSSPKGKLLSDLSHFGGLDTTFKFKKKREGLIAHPLNGRAIHIATTLPAVVIFTFNQAQPLFAPAPAYAGITFETQLPANDLQAVLLTKEAPYYAKTVYSFLHV